MTFRRRLRTAYLGTWIVGAIGAAVSHIALPRREAASSQWQPSPGWQREVGIFNIVIAVITTQAIRQRSEETQEVLVRAGALFSLLAGGAHGVAIATADGGETNLHRFALAMNLTALGATGVILALPRHDRE